MGYQKSKWGFIGKDRRRYLLKPMKRKYPLKKV